MVATEHRRRDVVGEDEARLENVNGKILRALLYGAVPGEGEWLGAHDQPAIDAAVIQALLDAGFDQAGIERVYEASPLGPGGPLTPDWREYLGWFIAEHDRLSRPGVNFDVLKIVRIGLPGETVWELHVAIEGRDRTEILPLGAADLVSQRKFEQRCLSVLGFVPRLNPRYANKRFDRFTRYVSEMAIDLPGRDAGTVLVTAVRALVDEHGGCWCATPAETLDELTRRAREYGRLPWGWPTAPTWLTILLRRLVPKLDEAGIEFHSGRWSGWVNWNRERYLLLRRHAIGTGRDVKSFPPNKRPISPRALWAREG